MCKSILISAWKEETDFRPHSFVTCLSGCCNFSWCLFPQASQLLRIKDTKFAMREHKDAEQLFPDWFEKRSLVPLEVNWRLLTKGTVPHWSSKDWAYNLQGWLFDWLTASPSQGCCGRIGVCVGGGSLLNQLWLNDDDWPSLDKESTLNPGTDFAPTDLHYRLFLNCSELYILQGEKNSVGGGWWQWNVSHRYTGVLGGWLLAVESWSSANMDGGGKFGGKGHGQKGLSFLFCYFQAAVALLMWTDNTLISWTQRKALHMWHRFEAAMRHILQMIAVVSLSLRLFSTEWQERAFLGQQQV